MKHSRLRLLHRRLAVLAAFLFATAVARAQVTSSPSIAISGQVIGASGKNAVYVALWNASGFLSKPIEQVRIAPGTDPVFRFQVPPGEYALSAFEDKNGNGILDMGTFGPKEPSGFWRGFHAWHKPRFADVSSRYGENTSGIQIRLH
jgi:uncharacterized protein (DUF2141 family)